MAGRGLMRVRNKDAAGAIAGPRPRHVGVIMDGNRRWATAAGYTDPSVGHRVGADHLADLLDWCLARAIHHLSVYVLSADNIRKRSAVEVAYLFDLIEKVVPERITASHHWQLHLSGDLGLLPGPARSALLNAVSDTAGRPCHLTLAIGYDPREDILTGIRNALRHLAGADPEPTANDLERAITANLPGGPVKDIDLVIRSSGEQRLSGFFPWQAQRAEVVINKEMWPAFTESDFDAALDEYAYRRTSA